MPVTRSKDAQEVRSIEKVYAKEVRSIEEKVQSPAQKKRMARGRNQVSNCGVVSYCEIELYLIRYLSYHKGGPELNKGPPLFMKNRNQIISKIDALTEEIKSIQSGQQPKNGYANKVKDLIYWRRRLAQKRKPKSET